MRKYGFFNPRLGTILVSLIFLVSCSSSNTTVTTNELPLNDSSTTDVELPVSTQVLGWVPFWDQQRALKTLTDNPDQISYVSMFWYYLTPDGNIATYQGVNESAETIRTAQDQGAKVLALVANSPDDQSSNWDAVRVRETLLDDNLRQQHINDLVTLALDFGFDGINIDYEAMPREDRQLFSTFIQELSEALHSNNKTLAVAIHPKTAEYLPSEDNGSHAQDWQVLSRYADQLHFMTYGEHVAGDEPGPVASLAWVERVIRFALENQNVPRDKLFLGIALYAEAWILLADGSSSGLNQEFTYSDLVSEVSNYGAEIQWDENSASPYVEINTGNGEKLVYWFENQQSVDAKMDLMQRYQLQKIAFWRFGGEDPQIWNSLR